MQQSSAQHITLATPLSLLKGIGQRFGARLQKLGIETVKDLIYYLPFRYQDFSAITPIKDVLPETVVTVFGEIVSTKIYRTPHKKMYIVEATVSDKTGSIKAVWFNQRFIITSLKKEAWINLSGKVIAQGKHLIIQSPQYEIILKGADPHSGKHTGRIVPVYPETKGVTSRLVRFAISKVEPFIKSVPEFLPKELTVENKLLALATALHTLHFPKTLQETYHAQERIAFQDLFLLQLINASEQHALFNSLSHSCQYDPKDISEKINRLPFVLTLAQKKALYDILEDLKKPHATNRLLQGDVGSGKTIVAALAALVVAQQAKQAIFMAPTEVLALQHYTTFKKFFPYFEGGVALLTASHTALFLGETLETELPKKDLRAHIAAGKIKIVIGTHAILQKKVIFHDVALVVIDEQHRFGVKQRAQLLTQADTAISPHLLSMSATPIPRTLALTVLGDLELSLINELPKDRKPIITKVVSPQKRDEAYAFIKKQIENKRQAYVVCPRIDPQEEAVTKKKLFQWEARSVKEEYDKLSKKIFPHARVGMLHGQMRAEEKTEVIEAFKRGSLDILVSTSVIEVGIDVPNATIMMIEGSEHFGLSQLYQFRGRVGRGTHQSYCFLFSDIHSKTTQDRLEALIKAKNGFELAEIDLRLRGPGQFLGEEQAGMPDIAAKAAKHPAFVAITRKAAHELIKKDPTLSEYPYLSAYLALFKKKIHLE